MFQICDLKCAHPDVAEQASPSGSASLPRANAAPIQGPRVQCTRRHQQPYSPRPATDETLEAKPSMNPEPLGDTSDSSQPEPSREPAPSVTPEPPEATADSSQPKPSPPEGAPEASTNLPSSVVKATTITTEFVSFLLNLHRKIFCIAFS